MLNFGICAFIVSALLAGNVWGVYGELDANCLYAVVFDTRGTSDINDDRVLTAVAMD